MTADLTDSLTATATDVVSDAVPDALSTEQPVATSALTEAEVAHYLSLHPQFFHQQTQLLLQLSIPHESGKAISLLERQVTVFRERQAQLQEQFHQFLSNAHANDNLFEKTRLMILALLQCQTLTAVYNLIFQHFSVEFHASAAGLVLVNDAGALANCPLPCIPSSAVRTALGELYQKKTTYCGPLNLVQSDLLFPLQPMPLLSGAIVPLRVNAKTALRLDQGLPLLLIASENREHFDSSLDTLFLDFLGEVLTIHLQNLLLA
jgi:uncharacterized protein